MQSTPFQSQVVKWLNTNIHTYGAGQTQVCPSGATNCTPLRNVLTLTVSGAWAPLQIFSESSIQQLTSGTTTSDSISSYKECIFQACQPNSDPLANNSACMSGQGLTLNVGGTNLTNLPCKISAGCASNAQLGAACSNPCNGYGLYGLIALNNNGTFADPNANAQTSMFPPSIDFRTFNVPLTQNADGTCSAQIASTQQCYVDQSAGATGFTCITDTDASGQPYVPQGILYFKILDSYYQDNTGGYNITITSGSYTGMGMIERTVEAFQSQLESVTQALYVNITQQFGFINIVRATVLLYIVMTALMFMMGNLNITQGELITRLFKISIVLIVISPSSFTFFNTYLFSFVGPGAQYIGTVILNATLFYGGDPNSPLFALPPNSNALAVFDVILNLLISTQLNAKVIGLLFTKYFYLIPIFWVCMGLIFLGMLRALLIYLTSIMLLALLIVIAPLFIIMILFQFTKKLFENWMNLLIASGMMIISVNALLALMVTLLLNQIENLFSYQVCWEYIFSFFAPAPNVFNFWDFNFWYPYDLGALESTINVANVVGFLIVSLIFEMVMTEIPPIIDALSKSQFRPVSGMASGAYKALIDSAYQARGTVSAAADLGSHTADYASGGRFATAMKRVNFIGTGYDALKKSGLDTVTKTAQGIAQAGSAMMEGDESHISTSGSALQQLDKVKRELEEEAKKAVIENEKKR
ncbi:MAG: type IV secretion system protein [Rickettsiales bacterium]